MTTAARTERRRGVVRDEVVETAWALAREGGVAAVSLKNVADRLGRLPTVEELLEQDRLRVARYDRSL